MTKDPKEAYRDQNTSDIDYEMLKQKSEENIYKKSKSTIKQKGHIK